MKIRTVQMGPGMVSQSQVHQFFFSNTMCSKIFAQMLVDVIGHGLP